MLFYTSFSALNPLSSCTTLTFKQLIAAYVTGNLTESDLPKAAYAGLQEGLESESLIILAGMGDKDNSLELEQYFAMSLKELDLQLPEQREAAVQLALYYADEICEGRLDPVEGVYKILTNCLFSYDFTKANMKYAFDSIGFEYVYGLYDTYDDLNNADKPWDEAKSNDELMEEVKTELFTEVEKWKKNNKGATTTE